MAQRERPSTRVTKTTGTDYLSRTTDMLTEAFSTDPVMHFFLNNAPSPLIESSLRHRFYTLTFTSASISHATFYEASTTALMPSEKRKEGEPGFHCAAVVMPPGRAFDAPGFWGWLEMIRKGAVGLFWTLGYKRFGRILWEFPSVTERAKKATFAPGEKYYYVLMVGTDGKYRGKGLCPVLLEQVKAEAQEAGKPIWLEATTMGSRKVYKKCGWVDLETDETEEGGGLRIGKGECDEQGNEKVGGKGTLIWPMVWWPVGYVKRSG